MENKNGSESSFVSMCEYLCHSCGTKIVSRLPLMRIFNYPESSGIIFTHEKMGKCPGCETIHVPMISSVENGQIHMIWREIKSKPKLASNLADVETINKSKM